MVRFLAGIALLFLLAGLTEGCRSTKKIQKVISTPVRQDTIGRAARVAAAPVRDEHADSMAIIRQTLEQLTRNHIDYKTFSAKVKVHYEGGDGKDNEFNAFIRMQKDSMIWISINAVLGFEAFRLLVTPDSVKILDRLKKVVRLRSVSYLQEEVHLPVDFHILQDLLLGNPIFLDTTHIVFYKTEAKGISLFSSGTTFRNYLTLGTDRTPLHSKLDDTDPLRSRTGDVTYGEYDYSSAVPFSTYRKVSVAEKSKVDVEINYKQFRFNEVLSFPFSIPKNYKRR